MVRKFERAHLFESFTFNPVWPEIQNDLDGMQWPENRTDTCVRVFKMEHSELLNDILNRDIFVIVLAHIYVIEFKREVYLNRIFL